MEEVIVYSLMTEKEYEESDSICRDKMVCLDEEVARYQAIMINQDFMLKLDLWDEDHLESPVGIAQGRLDKSTLEISEENEDIAKMKDGIEMTIDKFMKAR